MFDSAFQSNAFQNNAFQIITPSTGAGGGGGSKIPPNLINEEYLTAKYLADKRQKQLLFAQEEAARLDVDVMDVLAILILANEIN